MSITRKDFGVLPCGTKADLFILKNASGASVEITNYGGIIRAINVPDRAGKLGNVVLGYPEVNGYIPLCGYLGALIGRVGNRIANGECELNGEKLALAKNKFGKTHLHGGEIGFDRKVWDALPVEGNGEDALVLTYTSPDGEEGYPGTLKVTVTYTFTDDCELKLHYEAVSDKDTLCNLTNHTYFNLAGEGSGTVLDHRIAIDADTFTVVDADCIPTGEQRDVSGTLFDLRKPVRIGDGLAKLAEDEQLICGNGYDHNFNINGFGTGIRFAVSVTEPKSGRKMDVYTDMPAVQFYSGNGLKGINPGSCGRAYGAREGLCLETQYVPDSINHPNFIQCVLRAGDKYDFTTVYDFGLEN